MKLTRVVVVLSAVLLTSLLTSTASAADAQVTQCLAKEKSVFEEVSALAAKIKAKSTIAPDGFNSLIRPVKGWTF